MKSQRNLYHVVDEGLCEKWTEDLVQPNRGNDGVSSEEG